MVSARVLDILSDAIEAARAALRLMEADEVPARLRRVAAYSGGRLPPPLTVSLLTELETDQFLRSKALEVLGDPSGTSVGSQVSRAYLERQGVWVADVLEAALEAGARRASEDERAVTIERDSLQVEVAALKERLRSSRAEAERTERGLRAELAEARRPKRDEGRAAAHAAEQLALEQQAHARTEARLTAEIARAEAEVTRWQEEARRHRIARAEVEATAAGPGSGLPSGAADLARHLDDLAAHAIAGVERPESGSGSGLPDPRPLRLPPGVRPDTAAAIDWLAASDAGLVLVDGYNLGFALADDAAQARALALEASRRLAAACRTARVSVVFDGREAPDGPVIHLTGGVEVVFTAGQTADDQIVRRVDGAARAVVVSNDRDVRRRAEERGAIALWSDALVEWARRR